MTNAYDDLGGGGRETYVEAMARWNATRTESTMTEQALADKLVADRERMKRHDAAFAAEFIPASEQRLVSVVLARKLGHFISQPPHDSGDEFGDQDMSGTD